MDDLLERTLTGGDNQPTVTAVPTQVCRAYMYIYIYNMYLYICVSVGGLIFKEYRTSALQSHYFMPVIYEYPKSYKLQIIKSAREYL